MADDEPYELTAGGEPTGIVELPPEWITDDAVYFNMDRFSALRPYTPPSAVEEIFRAEFDGALEEGGLFLLTMHPHIIGHRSRVALLERLIKHMKAKGKCWFATHRAGGGMVPGARRRGVGRAYGATTASEGRRPQLRQRRFPSAPTGARSRHAQHKGFCKSRSPSASIPLKIRRSGQDFSGATNRFVD